MLYVDATISRIDSTIKKKYKHEYYKYRVMYNDVTEEV